MEGGSQAQDHGQAIYAKIRYSVSSTFATDCISEIANLMLCFICLFFLFFFFAGGEIICNFRLN